MTDITRFNSRPWILHCHIDLHLEGGFAVVFAEDPEGIVKGDQSVQVTDEWKNLCVEWDKTAPATLSEAPKEQ